MKLYYEAMIRRYLVPFAWTLSIVATALAGVAWMQSLLVPAAKLTIYDIFPLFGILAFSLMWTHYVVGAMRLRVDVPRARLNMFYDATAAVVLSALLLHPGLITWQTWRDGIGLPLNYVAPDLRLYIVLAFVAWIVFLLFELKRKYGERSWWHWVDRANELAMAGILIHGYIFGKDMLPAWFMAVWFVYGATLVAAIAYTARARHRETGQWL